MFEFLIFSLLTAAVAASFYFAGYYFERGRLKAREEMVNKLMNRFMYEPFNTERRGQ
jgi:hypothetical protein